ncbi:class I SAM-dependent methyltransferase [Streptomyces sp. NPDC059008]|uniref:class I SAM-dependent methyltransferase n=1 Tax=Streptomyces sp. NPDC059008 TaxID=3346693 RepID=UPI0036AE60D9
MLSDDHGSWGYTSSTGLGFTRNDVVEAHFAACAPYYRQALDEAGIEAGWHVLDAGCGSGSFLPLLADRVGAAGRVSAIDLAEENAARAAERTRDGSFAPPVDVRQGDVLDLPYKDGTFDAVWCANTTQYLDDDELLRALREFRRVVRPGGVIAVKDLDASLITARPTADPFLFTDFFRAAARAPGYARQLLRARDLYRRLAEAGLQGVRQRTVVMEHYAPMAPAVRRFYGLACARIAQQATDAGLAGDWQAFLDPDGAANPLRDPFGYISEGNVIAVGTAPMPTGTL